METPRTERGDQTRMDSEMGSFSMEASFHAPAGRDTLFSRANGTRTPRAALASMRNPNAKTEFTPLMKSVTKNRMRQANSAFNGGITTPAALKPGFDLGGTPLPEASEMNAMSSSFSETDINRTPMPQADSSAMSTPMALPRRGEGELDNGNGNVLTLREQEAVRGSFEVVRVTY